MTTCPGLTWTSLDFRNGPHHHQYNDHIRTTAAKVTSSTARAITQSVSRWDIIMNAHQNHSASLFIRTCLHELYSLHPVMKENEWQCDRQRQLADRKSVFCMRNAWALFCMRICFISHHFSALAMCSCASLIFCAAMALCFADEEDTDWPAVRMMRMRIVCYVDYPDFLQQLIHVTGFFYGSPSGMFNICDSHLPRFIIHLLDYR